MSALSMKRTPRTLRSRRRLWQIGLVLCLVATSCSGGSDAALNETGATAQATTEEPTPEPTEAPEPTPEPTEAPEPTEPPPEPEPEAEAAGPANDLLENAVVIDPTALPFTDALDTSMATSDSDDTSLGCPAPTIDASVWYSITPTSDRLLTVSAEGSDFPAGISAAVGEPGSLELIECRPLGFDVQAEAGVTYYFQVLDGEDPSSQGGELAFSVSDAAEAFATAAGSDAANPLGFEFCGDNSECATVSVPLDYAAPDGEMTEIFVTRHRATGERIGTLFLNPGGPGGAVEDMVKGLGNFGPPQLNERFDLVGVDPRGTGKSVPISCNTNWDEDAATVPTLEDGVVDDLEAQFEDFSAMASVCEETHGLAYLASITTENAVRDIETVRIALGDEPLNYLGYSYGTAIGAVYATLFPDSIRSMILDGAVPTNPATGQTQGAWIHEAHVRLDRSCELWSECPVAAVGMLNAIELVRQELDDNGSVGALTPLNFNRALGAIAGRPSVMPDVAQGLANALDGDGSLLSNIGRDFLTPLDDGGFAETSGNTVAIVCADGWNIATSDTDEILSKADEIAAAAPTIGIDTEVPCDLWPVTGDGIAPVNYTGSTKILVVGSTHDPITPLAWSTQLATELGTNATLLSWEGSFHTVVFGGLSRCIDDAALVYLVDLELPPAGTECFQRGLVGIDFAGSPVVIRWVGPGSPAEEAGVRVGDTVISENGTPIESPDDFSVGEAGTEIVLVVERDGEEITIPMTRQFAPWELWRTDLATE